MHVASMCTGGMYIMYNERNTGIVSTQSRYVIVALDVWDYRVEGWREVH